MPSRTPPVRVLIVEDEIVFSEVIRTRLIDLGYEVVGIARDSRTAVELICQLCPDVVLMDLRLPDPETHKEEPLAGLDVVGKLQEKCPPPIILLTAYESPELTQQASAAGVGAYLTKPVSDNELDRAIAITLARAKDMAELRRLNAELKAQNEELDAFAYTVAHNIKHQLAISIGYAELLEMDYALLPKDKLAEYIHELVVNGHKLDRIVNEILLLARVRSIEEIEIYPIHMGEIIQEIQLRTRDLIRKYQATLTLPDTWPQALGYAPWIEEVWFNYISNGIKYGGPAPHLTLGATKESNGMVRYWVRDTGKGLTQEQQRELFTPFERLSQVHLEGQGLGLSIVQRIIKKFGGHVGVESEPGQGCTFYFTLPTEIN